MSHSLTPSAQRFQQALKSLGFEFHPLELPQGTRTSLDAARAIPCRIEQIAKSIVFRGKDSEEPVLVIASGPNRVDEKKIEKLIGEPVEKGDAEFVREKTGFAIGGVPPAGHAQKIRTFIDEDLFKLKEIWSAAGNPNAVFRLTPQEIVKMTGGEVVDVKVD
jgi:prolyl-tRNA editing enzyme YbaK/EbsC (Cys-tRNA(Pro) deacylase)